TPTACAPTPKRGWPATRCRRRSSSSTSSRGARPPRSTEPSWWPSGRAEGGLAAARLTWASSPQRHADGGDGGRAIGRERVVELDRQRGERRLVGRDGVRRQLGGVVEQVGGRGSNGVVALARLGVVVAEAPPADPAGELRLFGAVDREARSGQDATVVGATGAGPVGIDRAASGDQHRAVAAFVVAEQHVT